MTNLGITGHLMVKNDDQWLYFAISSILPYVDILDIVDTGSTDNSIRIIKSFTSSKIRFSQVVTHTPAELTRVRQDQLERTTTPWFWIIDGDEIYPCSLAEEIVHAVSGRSSVIVVRRFDLLGDVYHRQRETVGEYRLYGQRGHLLVRLLNREKLPNLTLQGDYPLEGYFNHGQSILDLPQEDIYITEGSLFHAMYLKRSSQNISLNLFNRGKYKIETGLKITAPLPEVFYGSYPSFVPNPLAQRGLLYDLAATVITPVKNLKRMVA